MHGVEGAIRDVALRLEEGPGTLAVALARDHVDVADLAREGGIEVALDVQADGHAPDQAQAQSLLVGRREEPSRLVDDIRQDRRRHARATGVMQGQCIHAIQPVTNWWRAFSPSRLTRHPAMRPVW